MYDTVTIRTHRHQIRSLQPQPRSLVDRNDMMHLACRCHDALIRTHLAQRKLCSNSLAQQPPCVVVSMLRRVPALLTCTTLWANGSPSILTHTTTSAQLMSHRYTSTPCTFTTQSRVAVLPVDLTALTVIRLTPTPVAPPASTNETPLFAAIT